MKLGIRSKLFLVSLGLVVVSFVAADTYLTRGLAARMTDDIREDLFVRAQLVARDAASLGWPLDDASRWDPIADQLGAASEARVTIIARDGTVLGDSELDLAGVRAVENHGSRPEVVAAMSEGQGQSSRLSSTVRQRMMYVAVAIVRDGESVGVARLAKPLRAVDEAIGRVRNLIVAASLGALGLALLMSTVTAQWMSRVVRDLTLAARRMAAGDLDVRTHVSGTDELGDLGRALDQLASSLSTSLGQLREERDVQGRILDGMQEGVLVLDKDGRLVMMNPALRSMLLLGSAAIGKLLIEVVRHADLHELVERARAGRTTALGEIDLPGIKPRRLLTHATALTGEAGGLLAVFVDVTDLRRLESLRRDFIANVSHELRTPVTAVRSAAETLRGTALTDPDPAAAIRFVDIIERNAERLQSLIEDLLELSRLESQEFRLKREKVELPVVAGIVLALFRQRAEKKGVRLTAAIPATLPLLKSDQRALEQVIGNLVDNAIKYCPSGARVAISAAADESGSLRITVEDTGPGIASKHLPRLFERFYRVDAGRSRDVGGTGLGLSIVKHLVEAMGGSIAVDSTVGKGSSFNVTLPAST